MKAIKSFFLFYTVWVVVGALSKPLFLLCNTSILQDSSPSEWLKVVWYGLQLDVAVAGYITIVLALLLIAWLFAGGKHGWQRVWKLAIMAFSVLYALAVVADIFLYPHWGFPLDTTALFYLSSSPSDAVASITAWQMIISGSLFLLLTGLLIWLFHKATEWCGLTKATTHTLKHRILESLLILLLAGALIIPIRGGFSTATNNSGSVYFCNNMGLNHAAVNPVFSFVESLTLETDLNKRFRYLDDDEATRLFNEMTFTQLRDSSVAAIDSVALKQRDSVNVVMVILESFSCQIMEEGGKVKGVVPNFDALAQEGLYFTNFYANSFRTDRGLVSILSGYPAQPDMSIMKEPHKTLHLSSIARTLHDKGYATTYYYGGDANFTNMHSYVVQTGFTHLISEDDFPLRQHTGKWGVQDEHLFQRVLQDLQHERGPYYKVIQTLSSHEPYEVPYKSRFNDPALNAFAYTDHYLGLFVAGMKALPSWKNTLLILVPDHLGCYPEPLDNYKPWRYRIPLIMAGGVVEHPQRINTLGMQVDIPATLLGLLGINHSDFAFSKDMLDQRAPHFAFFNSPGVFGMATDSCTLIYDYQSEQITHAEGESAEQQLRYAKAYLQKLYDDLANR